ncbi:hypothetical protein ACFXKW_04760 [Streptomyces sp. NPDC059193]|uniref:hypothetical protein n=1 Tax=Streptomyces sp. NPDC059193 TaxID=3346763 RepID=UPI0036A61960
MTPGHCLRAVRAAMFAAVCVLLAAVGHILMSGTGVPWWALSAALAGTGAAAWALAGRERGLLCVTTATVAVQAALHSGFSLVQSSVRPAHPARPAAAVAAAVPDAGAHAHHAHHAAHGTAGAASEAAGALMPSGGHDMAGMSLTGLSPADMSQTGMLAAHLLAALLCGLWLAYGEQGAFRVLRAVAGRLRAPLRLLAGLAPAPLPPRVRVRRERHGRALPQLFLVHAITSRGPPTGTAVL